MAKHIQLTIAEPCHENWEVMTAAEKGRFCGSCQKQVVDFTDMSDAQVAAFFKKPSTGSVCGRFMNDQLGRDIAIPRKRIPWLKYFFQLTIPLFLSSLKSNAQMGKIAVKPATKSVVCDQTMMGDVEQMPAIPAVEHIKGKVIDEEGKPVPYASVMIKGTHSGTPADSSGRFIVIMPLEKQRVILIVSSVNFVAKEVEVSVQDIQENKGLTIQLTKSALSEVVLKSSYDTKTIHGLMGAVVFIRKATKKTSLPPLTNTPAMRVYPNPVSSGSSIHINCDKMEESYYSFHLLTLSGQMALQKEIWIDKEARVLNMDIPTLGAGTYLLRMTSKKSGKSFTDKIVIQ